MFFVSHQGASICIRLILRKHYQRWRIRWWNYSAD